MKPSSNLLKEIKNEDAQDAKDEPKDEDEQKTKEEQKDEDVQGTKEEPEETPKVYIKQEPVELFQAIEPAPSGDQPVRLGPALLPFPGVQAVVIVPGPGA